MHSPMDPAERLLLAIGIALLAAALAGPAVPAPAGYHAFADQRTLWGLPHALDVLSNLPFAVAGWLGLRLLRGEHAAMMPPVQRACARIFFAGLVLTTFCSTWYHLAPGEAGLAIDRAGMSVAFAGVFGLLAVAQVSERAGRWVAVVSLAAGPVTLLVALLAGNVLPWALVQGGGLLLLLVFGLRAPRRGALAVRWGVVLALYVIAKLLELADATVFAATGELVSGHTLKHLLAAAAAAPVLSALSRGPTVQNAAHSAAIVRA
jgi:predicted membrane channel-forming protein YqfA (hemolysin III family)